MESSDSGFEIYVIKMILRKGIAEMVYNIGKEMENVSSYTKTFFFSVLF